MEAFLGDHGLGCLTLLPLPIALLVVGLGAVAAGGFAFLFAGSFFACCGGLMVLITVDRGLGSVEPVEVVGHHWSRRIDIEELQLVEDEDWCDDLPADARVLERHEKFHHRDRRIGPDRDIYEDWCVYEVPEWREVDHEEASGDGLSPAPRWPEVNVDGCSRIGCRRPGDTHESLEVRFEAVSGHTGEPWSCDEDDVRAWASWQPGDRGTLLVGGLMGTAYCGDLVRTSPPSPVPDLEPEPEPRPRPDKGRRERDAPRERPGGGRRGRRR